MAITIEQRNELVGLTVTMFRAAPGVEVLNDLVGARDGGASLKDIAAILATKAEFQQVYPSLLTAQEFSDEVIGYLLPASTPAADVAWSKAWIIEQLGAGVSRSDILVDAAQALMATTNTGFADAQALMNNRIDVANHYSVVALKPTTTLPELQDVLVNVTADPASVDAAKIAIDASGNFVLTVGADTITGTSGVDTFTAQTVNAIGGPDTTFSSFDKLDGGSGIDTLNIFSDGVKNVGFPANATVTNIEIININNTGTGFGAVKASQFVGATAINQIGVASVVTELSAGTTAGFQNIAANNASLVVRPEGAATSATVALANVKDNADLTIGLVSNANSALNTVTISGTLLDNNNDGVAVLDTTIRVGKDVQTLTLNTAVDIDLKVNDSGSTKQLSTIDATASTGGIALIGDGALANVTTGSGNDNVALFTVLTNTVKSATLNSGEGNDTLNVAGIAGKGTVTIDAGAGDDTITLAGIGANVTLAVDAGAGDDEVNIAAFANIQQGNDVIDGGAGSDTVVIAGKSLAAGDYIAMDEELVGFEGIKFTGAAATIDASRMTSYKEIEFTTGNNAASKVAADQLLTTSANLLAAASGYIAAGSATGNSTYAGTLNITATNGAVIAAGADTVNLTVAAVDNDGVADAFAVDLRGDVKTANVTLGSGVDDAGTPNTADDVFDLAVFNFANGPQTFAATNAPTPVGGNNKLAALTISGNGIATVTNNDGTALVTVDASELNSVDANGNAYAGLDYTSLNTKAETITLGGGIDNVDLTGSSVLNMDTVVDLNLVDDGSGALDVTSDVLTISDATSGAFDVEEFTAANLNLALLDAAASTKASLVFAFGGDTYVYEDVGNNNVLDDTDILVKIVGTVDLDLLADSL